MADKLPPPPLNDLKGLPVTFQNWLMRLTTSQNSSSTNVTLISSNVTNIGTSNSLFACDASSANLTIPLPSAVGISGTSLGFKKVDSTAGTVTINTVLTQTIDGETSATLDTQYDLLSMTSDGANWMIS